MFNCNQYRDYVDVNEDESQWMIKNVFLKTKKKLLKKKLIKKLNILKKIKHICICT